METENKLEQRIIVSYSPKFKLYQRSIRNKQIDRALIVIDKKANLNDTNLIVQKD
ncbi:hypothetical protein [Mycoplasma sp. P36-A1]|uniref:hypothetical protein n=1 Tax=Mycoplasma sp. P36-A1 TaxID=3252900 RepID=UPI003C2E1B8E